MLHFFSALYSSQHDHQDEEEEEVEEEEEGIPLSLPPGRQQLHAVWKLISDHEFADPFR
jgi:hypothetical protein